MTSPSSRRNRLLKALSPADLALLQPDLEPMSLPLRLVLEAPNKPIKHNYFIESGLASIVAGNGQKRLEVGLIGREGMTGLAIVLGNDRSPYENFIQIAGKGARIPAEKLREAMQQSRSLERVFIRFAHSFLNQTAASAFSNGTASLRNAWRGGYSWLMTVWTAMRYRSRTSLRFLEGKAVIRMSRGQIVVMDREGLKASAKGTYHESRSRKKDAPPTAH
jgi:hypothetical protein